MPPIKNTAGEGFSVEDAVGAWLACHMLAGVPWPNLHTGELRALKFQMRQDGWHFDDVVIEAIRNGESYRIGCSIKSFPVFGPEGTSAEFGNALWAEWLDENSPFLPGRDQIALFAAEHRSDIAEAWRGLLDAAHSMEAATLARRIKEGIEPSGSKRAAFTSLQELRPSAKKNSENGEETAQLLSSFTLQEHDFDHLESRSVSQAILLCQQSLADGARANAVAMWEAVVIFVSEIRRKGGVIDQSKLLDRLAHRFQLKQHPQFAADWDRIRKASVERLSVIPAKIGGRVELERTSLKKKISDAIEAYQGVALLGGSGFGKTVLARTWIAEEQGTIPIWIRSSDLTLPLGLQFLRSGANSISDIFDNASQPVRVVLDGLDRCYEDQAFSEAALLLQAASNPDARERFKIIVTCQPDEWDRVRQRLVRHGVQIKFGTVAVRGISKAELRQVAKQIPAISPLILRPHLLPLLISPKVLDIVAIYWSEGSTDAWASESDFAQWFWRSAIAKQQRISLRTRLAQKIAVATADRLILGIPIGEFSSDELVVLRELEEEQHLSIDENSTTVRFTHDLVGDYARLSELLTHSGDVCAFLRERLHSPLWHRSIRLFGLSLLEKTNDSSKWEFHFNQFDQANPVDEMARNLLLEAPIFALRQCEALERLWPVFAANEGELLKRFLRQFLRVATTPNERALAQSQGNGPDVQLEVAVKYRWPFIPYWPGVLAFLGVRAEEVVALARSEIADVCLLWLAQVELMEVGMADAAGLAVASARIFYRSGTNRYSSPNEVSPEEKVCRALLAAAPVLPEQVAELTLKMSGRRLPDPEDGLPLEEPESRSQFQRALGAPVPWPEGPRIRPISVFCEVFMLGGAAAPFLRALPEVGAEVMFATLLNIPRENQEIGGFGFDWDEHGFNHRETRTDARFWTSGPFLSFLQAQPQTALSAIIRLINFGTDRAQELPEDDHNPFHIIVRIGGEDRSWDGHQHTYLWHRGHVFGPWAVCCALMALEKWLYDLMDDGQSLDEVLGTILNESRSIALGAVLVAVGKRRPELFLGVLKPILATAEFYWLDTIADSPLNHGALDSPMFTEPEWLRKEWREWMQMPHRSEKLSYLSLKQLLTSPEWLAMMEKIRGDWQKRVYASDSGSPVPEWLPMLIAQFDPANWSAETHEGGTILKFIPPTETIPVPTPEDEASRLRFEKLRMLPFQCMKILQGESESTEEIIASWWAQLPLIRSIEVPEDERGISGIEDALCGIVAVAVVYHREWLLADDDRENTIWEVLSEVVSNPPVNGLMRYDAISQDKWDNFAAWTVAVLWTSDPTEPSLRYAVALFATWDRYRVVETVFRVASAKRRELGEEFDRLLALSIRFAQAKHRAMMEFHTQEKTFDLQEWSRFHIVNFENGNNPLLPKQWSEIRDEIPGEFRNGSLTNDFDAGQLNASLAWASDLEQAYDADERDNWLRLHEQAIICSVYRIQYWAQQEDPEYRLTDAQRRSPYKDEDALIDRIGKVVAGLRPGEDHARLWRPIFALGADSPRWVERFVSHWFSESAGAEPPAESLAEQWVAMLDYAENSEAWKKTTRDYRGMEETWPLLLGLSSYGSHFLRLELEPAVKSIRPYFDRWSERKMCNSGRVRTILQFLRTPAAQSLRLDYLAKLKQTLPLQDEYFWRETSTQDSFARFLRLLSEVHWKEVSSSVVLKEAFMTFALKLSALQHALGSEILILAGQRLAGFPNPNVLEERNK